MENNKEILDDKISKLEEQVSWVFSIESGKSEDEFYSFSLPLLSTDGTLTLLNPFKKGIVQEQILDKIVEEYYVCPHDSDEKKFFMPEGILLKQFDISAIVWLATNRTKAEAENIIKDKVIRQYQVVVPQLMNRINTIETQIKQKQTQKNNNGGLLEL